MRKVSFKISKRGTRYRSKPKHDPSVFVDDEVDDTTASSVFKHHHHQLIPACVERDIDFSKKRSVVDLTEDDDDEDTDDIPDADVSFIVNIFPDGYTIDKSLKSNAAQQIASMYDPRLLRPYDRASQSLFAAIKCCRVPANFFEDIPCTYKNGKVACEVRDWRKDSSEQAGVSINGPSVAATPSIRRISLRMSVDSIVRDIPQMSKRDFWAYSELLEAEAKILLALYPKLDLDPYPNFDRLCKKPATVKLNLDFRAMRRKRLRQMSVPEKSNLRTDGSKPMMDQPNVVNLAAQNVGQRTAMGPPNSVNLATQNVGHRNRSNSLASSSAPGASSTHAMQSASSNQDRQSSFMANSNNRNWSDPLALIGNHQQMTLEVLDNTPGTAFNASRASNTRYMSLPTANDGRRSFVSAFDGRTVNQDGHSSFMAKRNRLNPSPFNGNQLQQMAGSSSHMDKPVPRRQKSVGASVPAIGPVDIIIIEDDEPVQRRSSSRPPKSGEFSSGATRRQYRAAARSSSQTERSVVNSVPAVGGSRSSSSNTNNSMHPTRMAATPGSKPLPTIPILSGIWPSSTIGNTSGLKPYPVGTSNASRSSSTHNMWMNPEDGGFSVPSPSSPISDAINSLIQTSDAMVLTSHSVSIGQDLSMQQQLDFNPVSQNPILQQQQSQRRGNMMEPGNVVGTVRNIGGGNSVVGGQESGNVRRGVPRAGRRGASPLVIFDPNPMEINQGSTISTASIRRASILGRSRGQSSAGGSQGGTLQVPSGEGKGSRGRGSRGRGSHGRGSRGRGSRGRGSDITPDDYVNPRERNGMGRQPRMALSKPSVLGAFGEQSSNTGVVRIGNLNIDSSLISGSGSEGPGSRGLLVKSTSGSSRASDMNRMQRNSMASPRSISDMNQNQMQQQTNLQPASVSTSVNSGASRPSVGTASVNTSVNWIDDEFMRNLMT